MNKLNPDNSPRPDLSQSALDADQFRVIWWHHPDTVYILDTNGVVLKQGEAAAEFLGLPMPSRVGLPLIEDDLVHPDDRERVAQFKEALCHGSQEFVTERFRRLQPDGTDFVIELTGIHWRRMPHEMVLAVVSRDVTLQASEEAKRMRLSAIVDSSAAAIISKTLDGTITSWNHAAENLLGFSAEEMIGGPIDLIIPEDRKDEEREILRRIARGERIDHFDTMRLARSGQRIDVSLVISPICDDSGRVVGASKIMHDVSRQKRLYADLSAAKDAAEAASRSKETFLAVLSHELRTPLTPTLASLGQLEQLPELSADIREEIASIRRNVELEARLIDDLLDVTPISHGKFTLKRTSLDLHATIRAAVAICQADIDAKRIELSTALHAEHHFIHGDSARIQQVFWNLIKNAVKFTPKAGAIRIRSSNPEPGSVLVTVSDTGLGIAPELRSKIFDMFEQGERSITRKYGGLGLGLTIAKLIVTAHDGDIRVADIPESQGATFLIEFATIRPTVEPIPTIERAEAPRMREETVKLLLIEDNLETLRAFTRVLTWNGFVVRSATTVSEALEISQEERFALVISDIGLPDGSGLDVMRLLREQQGLRGIACSGFGSEDDIAASLNAGFIQHLVKPVTLNVLLDAIHSAIN